jgi:putative N-acetylmannosamine-6-phosphate epimerase/predicted NBD/HSP70 family sugar kinase
MTLDAFQATLESAPLVASVQASPGSPLDDDDALLLMAKASLREGVKVLRLEGAARVKRIREATSAVCIGLVKRAYEGAEVYITPTAKEVDELLETGCEIVSLDCTPRARPNDEDLGTLVKKCHDAGRLVMADCDTFGAGQNAVKHGADILGPTLAGYTPDTTMTMGPDLPTLQSLLDLGKTTLAEGRYQEEWHVEAALRMGAHGVVIGGALNDPVKQTRKFLSAAGRHTRPVAAFDLGGTWMRFGHFSAAWELKETDWVSMPETHTKRLDWMNTKLHYSRADRAGVSSGGVVDPLSGQVLAAKPLISGLEKASLRLEAETFALNDGLAQAWGHACYPLFAGKSVATLALGTGVGSGFVHHYEFVPVRRGFPCGINDLSTKDGTTIEECCGGKALGKDPTEEQRSAAVRAAREAVRIIESVYAPDIIVLSGGVGLTEWMLEALTENDLVQPTPFGHDAGLFGAAALALFPPRGVFS